MENEAKENIRNIGKIAVITLAVYAGIRWLVPLFLPFLAAREFQCHLCLTQMMLLPSAYPGDYLCIL